MTKVDRAERKVLRLAKVWATGKGDVPLLEAVVELQQEEKYARAKRVARLKTLIYCKGCKSMHSSDYENTFRKKPRKLQVWTRKWRGHTERYAGTHKPYGRGWKKTSFLG